MMLTPTFLDRAIGYVAPIYGARRWRARLFQAMAGSYVGASRSRRSLSQWNPGEYSADGDTIYDQATLRARSRDLIRNTPVATGAINTVVTNVVGTGLKLKARIDAQVLGLTPEEADAWESQTEREWNLFAQSSELDVCRTLTFEAIQDLAFRSTLESGDVFLLLTSINRPGSPYRTKLQLVESDRVANRDSRADTERLIGGVEKDEYGAPVAYHVLTTHPGDFYSGGKREWRIIPAFTRDGRRNVIHLYKMLRPDQTRGVPYLAPVIEPLKQLDRYTEAELMAAVVAGMFTVFVKNDLGDASFAPMSPSSAIGGASTDEDYKLGNGAIIGLAPGEDVTATNPGRPNTAFDPFVQAVLRQVGVALELPFEILIKHFTASYSAARAALLEAWKFFQCRRSWLANAFCQEVYEAFLMEAVLLGRINAPGYLSDPLLRKAYAGACWIGPAKGMINELDEVRAAGERIQTGLSTREEETAALTGGDWERNHQQAKKEQGWRTRDGLESHKSAIPQDGTPLRYT